MNTHQVLLIVVDTRILGCVTDPLQERRFASIGPSDYKYTKVSILRPEVIGITIAHHVVVGYHWVRVKRTAWEQYHCRGCPHIEIDLSFNLTSNASRRAILVVGKLGE